jgi:hypothetical protein
MLTRIEIIEMAKRVARRLAANQTGVVPAAEKHVRRLAYLKKGQKEPAEAKTRQEAKAKA